MKIKLFLIFLLFPLLLFAKNDDKVKKERRIYLWDVTMSMQGYGKGNLNIWDDVKSKLIRDIDGIIDPDTEIILLPFQHKIIDSMKVYANTLGKNELKSYISRYDIPRLWVGNPTSGHEVTIGERGRTTMTRLYAPIIQCVNSFIFDDRTNVLVIMTDGKSDFEEDQKDFEDLIKEKWCDLATDKDIYAFYFMLTPNAVIEKINEDNICRFITSNPNQSVTLTTFVLRPEEVVFFNVKENFDKPIKIHFTTNNSKKIEDRFVIHVKSNDNPYFIIDDDVELDLNDNTITLKPKMFFGNSEEMRSYIIQHDGSIQVDLSYESGRNMNKLNPYVSVSNIPTKIEFIVAKERIVNIEWINE